VDVPLPWERLLWSGRPTFLLLHYAVRRERYAISDLRVVCLAPDRIEELALPDVGEVRHTESVLERLVGASTLELRPRDRRRRTVVLRGIRRGTDVAALLDLLTGDERTAVDVEAARAAIAWRPRPLLIRSRMRQGLAATALALAAIVAIAIALHGRTIAVTYAPDDPITPGGVKRPQEEIVQFMVSQVMPWARAALGPIKGGPAHVTCDTCHGAHPETRAWTMPSVAALPQPAVKSRGWENYGGAMDAQMRNAIYGYIAESDKQDKAAYMREVIVPGMSRLLRRPAYDFTRPYEYNRERGALGCYHCHQVK